MPRPTTSPRPLIRSSTDRCRRAGWGLAAAALLASEASALPAPNAAAAEPGRPDLLLMTGLPIVWGEGGAFDPQSRPAASYRVLEARFAVRPIDAIEPATLRGARLMLLAQPRLLAAEELVALDDWVRSGGRLLVLTDPRLDWPSELALGDVRRAPALPLLGPLLQRWGLRLDPVEEGPTADRVETPAGARRIAFAGPGWEHGSPPGRFVVTGPGCALGERQWLARCRIGQGVALLVADADLLHDETWLHGAADGRLVPTADNPFAVTDWLDSLAGVSRPAAAQEAAQGKAPDAAPDEAGAESPRMNPLFAAAPAALLLLAAGLILARRRRQPPTNLSTGSSTENN